MILPDRVSVPASDAKRVEFPNVIAPAKELVPEMFRRAPLVPTPDP